VTKHFAKHPQRIRRNPNQHSKVMNECALVVARSVEYDRSNNHRGANHRRTECFVHHTPTHVFEEPKDNVQVIEELESTRVFFHEKKN